MGYFVATSTSQPTANTSFVRLRHTITAEQFTQRRLSLGALSSSPRNCAITIRGIGTQWPDKDFRVRPENGETFLEWNEVTDGMHDVIRAGDDLLIEFNV